MRWFIPQHIVVLAHRLSVLLLLSLLIWGACPQRAAAQAPARDDERRDPFERFRDLEPATPPIVPAEAAWPQQLEQVLLAASRPGDRPVEVLNLGVGGYSSRDEALVLRHKALPLAPDLIIVGYALNDPDTEPLGPLHEYWRRPAWWQHSALLRELAGRRHQSQLERWGGGDSIRAGHADPDSWRTVEAAFADMAAAASAAGVPEPLDHVPVNVALDWAQYRSRELPAQVPDAAGRAGFAVLDLLPVFAAHDPETLRVAPDDGHPSAVGQRLAAQTIAERLAQRPDLLSR